MADILFISLIHLIQHPDQYHGRHVRVIGFGRLGFESKAVYVSPTDYEHAVTKNAVWLAVELTEQIKKYDKHYIVVEGTFDQLNLGHLKLYSGSLTKIERLDLWESGAPTGD